MRVVVVGGTGNVGRLLVRSLAVAPGVDSVVGIARRRPGEEIPGVEWETADVRVDDLTERMRGAAVVVHLAWLFQPTHDPVVTWRANVLGSVRVFRAVVAAKVPALVYGSSIGAYSPGPKDRAVDENWPTNGWPTAAYAREKAYLERVLDILEHEQPDLRIVRMRPGFMFRRRAASQQRRLFGGPLIPGSLVRPGLVPFVPALEGLRLQVLHTADAVAAYRTAVLEPVRGAFNLAAEPVLDAAALAGLLRARTVRLPVPLARAGLAAAWHLHLAPASPYLLDVALRVPLMDCERAARELGWTPRHTSLAAIQEFLAGLRAGSGEDTGPLEPGGAGPLRSREVAGGMGERP